MAVWPDPPCKICGTHDPGMGWMMYCRLLMFTAVEYPTLCYDCFYAPESVPHFPHEREIACRLGLIRRVVPEVFDEFPVVTRKRRKRG